jgi:hypothetical protein
LSQWMIWQSQGWAQYGMALYLEQPKVKSLAELSVAENTVSYLVFYMLEKCSYFY